MNETTMTTGPVPSAIPLKKCPNFATPFRRAIILALADSLQLRRIKIICALRQLLVIHISQRGHFSRMDF
jgi:hypothetical protein